jgi:dipeptidyl aminopeptidase/acylaminoacyl peptidase
MAGLQVVGDACWWTEGRPHEGGRQVVMRLRRGVEPEEMSPPGVNIRSEVHEYGGVAFWAEGDGLICINAGDKALWWLEPEKRPERLTPPAPRGETHRYGDVRTVAGGRWLVCVRERHHGDVVDDEIVAVDRLRRVTPAVLCSGRDFYAAPRPSPDGRRLAFVAWDHPNMPWDGSELWVADLDLPEAGRVGHRPGLAGTPSCIAGGPDESVGQPTWAGEDLWFVSDRFDWWQPYRWGAGVTAERMCSEEAEFHEPDWVLGQATLDFRHDGHLVCRFRRDGRDRVGILDPATGALTEVAQPCVTIAGLRCRGAGAEQDIVVLGSTATEPGGIHAVAAGPVGADPEGTGPEEAGPEVALYRPAGAPLDVAWVSVPREIRFPTVVGIEASLLFHPPHGPGLSGPEGTLPPLVVVCHGGPTSGAEPGFNASVQMWSTRGVAVAVVDYRGSSGHGRAFRRLLDGQWGVADAEDCMAAARFLADKGLVDGGAMVIKGSSAGGLTALRSLVAGGPFVAAVVSYGVTDLSALAADTHKFESHYTDRLVGPLPEAAAVYEERSPACHPERIEGAVLLLQGSKDPIVPPDQAERMAKALESRGLRCDKVVFEGEGHGFRRADTLTRCAELEIAFVREVLGIAPGD